MISDSVRAAFPFTVDKLPLSGPENLKTPHYGLFRSDNGASVGVACRKGYEPHTVDDVCALVEAAASAFDGDAKARCLFHDGHYVTVEPSAEYRRSIFGTADNIWPRLIIRAGYDGRAFRAQLGFYRDACRNLAMIRSDRPGRRGQHSAHHATTRQAGATTPDVRRIGGRLGWRGGNSTADGIAASEPGRFSRAKSIRWRTMPPNGRDAVPSGGLNPSSAALCGNGSTPADPICGSAPTVRTLSRLGKHSMACKATSSTT